MLSPLCPNILKGHFALDHFHYASWLTIYLFDLISLRITAPDVHKKFSEGHFAFQKTLTEFSNMSLDQVHEQNNAYIKGVSGATHLVNRSDDAGLIRWELCSSEIARMVQEFENELKGDESSRPKKSM